VRVDDFDFDLPRDRIALRPARPRDAARLLVIAADGSLSDRRVRDLPELLARNDILVANDTRVMAARLKGVRTRAGSAAQVEAMLCRQLSGDRWRALVKPARRLMVGDSIQFAGALRGQVEEMPGGGEAVLRLSASGDLDQAIERAGEVPLPPYILAARPVDARDRRDYQTLFAKRGSAVAAPTAGLHFTRRLLARLSARGIRRATVTLNVGPGTFLPVRVDDTADHRLMPEGGEVGRRAANAIAAARAAGGRLVAVGTTVTRLAETAADSDGTVAPYAGDADLFITPGYRFKAVDVLMTNFHLPRSTLFMLVAAFIGLERARAAYAHAIAEGYRFYSYGDACLMFRPRA
jgi:S-adenosylmethionine:tRNA ribosyltransferase-isomerase